MIFCCCLSRHTRFTSTFPHKHILERVEEVVMQLNGQVDKRSPQKLKVSCTIEQGVFVAASVEVFDLLQGRLTKRGIQ